MINVNISEFEGPMDLLLKLIEKDKINIYDIPINKITEQYIGHINKMNTDAENMSDFILMASTLLEIKSRMLIPSIDEEAEDPRDDLVQRLVEYKKIKIMSNLLKEMERQASLSFTKLREEPIIKEVVSINIEEDINLLSELFYKLLIKYEIEDEENPFDSQIINRDDYTVEKYIDKILDKINKNNQISFKNIVSKDSPRPERIVIFIAILELIKQNRIVAFQNNSEDILLEYKEIDEYERQAI
ncbi:MAG: segregation/condensation protein A [Tissierellia bacterium]|nr:segregation/condensation protein A [Tissierellia bacterium]